MVGWDGSANDDGMRGCVDEKVARVRRELPQGLKPLIEFFGEGKKEVTQRAQRAAETTESLVAACYFLMARSFRRFFSSDMNSWTSLKSM